MEIINACGNAYTIAIMNETFQRRANLGKMLILSTGYYGGIYYHGILLDAFRKHDAKRARVMMEEHLQHAIDAARRGGITKDEVRETLDLLWEES